MSETATEPTAQATQSNATQSLEDLLAPLDDTARKVVLDQVGKARTEAKSLRDRVKAAEPQLAKLSELEKANQTELERWQSFGNQEKDRADKAESDFLRLKVAYESGLPKELAGRLQGDDEATLREDAKTLLSLVPKQDANPRAPRVDLSQGSSAAATSGSDAGHQFAAILKQQMGR